MKSLILLTAIALGGCSTVAPVTQPWPEPPGLQATQPCALLEPLKQDPKLHEVAQVVANNYTQYWICATKLEAWQEWYQKQKLIHEGLK